MNESIGFLGLGALGLPVASNLLAAGHSLRVWNRTAQKAEPLVARGAEAVAQPADAVTPGGVVVTLLWDGPSVEEVAAQFAEKLGEGGVHVSMSTISPDAAKRLAALHAAHGSSYVEAPIFGRPEAATAKGLFIPLAGPAAAKARVKPLLEAMGAKGGAAGVFDFGEEIGAAVAVKIAGNFMIFSAARSMQEALAMAEKNGAAPAAVIEMLTTTLFATPLYQSYGKALAAKVPMPKSDIPWKDIGLFTRTAAESQVKTPIGERIYELLASERAAKI